MAYRKGIEIQWHTKKGQKYKMAYRKGTEIQWHTEKGQKYNGIQKRDRNPMAYRKGTKRQGRLYNTLHRKLKIE